MKRSTKERKLLKRAMTKPWKPLEPTSIRLGSSEADEMIRELETKLGGSIPIPEVYANHRYTVHREEWDKSLHGFGDFSIVWLSIKANDGSCYRDWRDYQRIKNQLAGPDWEGIEIYPNEQRLIDTCNQFHIWCIPPEAGLIPVGWYRRAVCEENTTTFGTQRPFEAGWRPRDTKTEKDLHSESPNEESWGCTTHECRGKTKETHTLLPLCPSCRAQKQDEQELLGG